MEPEDNEDRERFDEAYFDDNAPTEVEKKLDNQFFVNDDCKH